MSLDENESKHGGISWVTNEGWPEPNEWINRLYQDLAHRQEIYEAEPDDLLKRNKAGGMLGAVISALHELPAFKNSPELYSLKDLLSFLNDLDHGRQPTWAQPTNIGGTNYAYTADRELRAWIRATHNILQGNGFTPTESYRRIAAGLDASGRMGRHGKPIRWRLVGDWCRESAHQREIPIQEKVGGWWAKVQADTSPQWTLDTWKKPLSVKEKAGRFADKIWSLPHLRDRSVSPPQEQTAS